MPTTAVAGQTAIVTGASSGIGAATCQGLAAAGATVVLAARSEGRLQELASEIETDHGGDTLVVPTDVREETAVDTLIDKTVAEFGGIDILVNNAGLARGSDVETMSTAAYETMQETNIDGMFYATRAAIPHVRERDGHLIFVGSFAGQYPRSYNAVYAASKWWTRGFAKSVAAQVGDDGVGVTVVNPGAVRTEFEAADGQAFEDVFEKGEASDPEEVAETIVFAASRDGSSVSEIDINNRSKFADDF